MPVPPPRLVCLRRAATAIAVALAVVTGLLAVPAAGVGSAGRSSPAGLRALARARELFRPAAVLGAGPSSAVSRDGTIVLRDLFARVPELTGADRQAALSLLARPTDGPSRPDGYRVPSVHTCVQFFCVHWVRSTQAAPSQADRNHDGRPDYVESVIRTLNRVWRTEIGTFRYRRPKSDLTSRNHGPNGKLDIYLADVGSEGLYGYCTSDDPNLQGGYRFGDLSAYCVLDNDYRTGQFPSGAHGVAALQVTAAHEFFHAVQFAYDAFEDVWLMEGTAVWMEDEVFNGVNDNRQYFEQSPLKQPSQPLDRDSQLRVYGSWIFFRHLSEGLGRTIIRQIWERADAAKGGPDRYSTAAINAALRLRSKNVRDAFAAFGQKNADAAEFYREGAAYPIAPRTTFANVDGTGVPAHQATIDHLATRIVQFEPDSTLLPGTTIEFTIDGPATVTGPGARVLVDRVTGPTERSVIPLDTHGDGAATFDFDPATVTRVILTLTNGSIRFRCGRGTVYSCRGTPLDDDQVFTYTATVA